VITQTETVRLVYQLPADPHNQFAGWQRNDSDRFPEDRAEQERRNRAEFAARSAAHLITRRPRAA
jgi:hypothetical protein